MSPKLTGGIQPPALTFSETGFTVIPDFIDAMDLERISQCIDAVVVDGVGTRGLITAPWCAALANRVARDERLRPAMPVDAVPVQCTLFVKSTTKNWLVSLHQDLSMPVAQRVTGSEYSGWSEKEGQIFVQPPIPVLDEVLAVRIHLDACDESNGALRVVPGSHRLGRLTAAESQRVRYQLGETVVTVPRGGAMLMRPLLLHASSKASVSRVRRV